MNKRIPVIAANWKMYKTKDEALEFIFAVNGNVPERSQVESIICAPAILLNLLVKREGEHLRIGAQNMHYADEGAFTGENSPAQVKTAGADYILIGHSERRSYFGETDKDVNLKMQAAFKYDLTPILCVGEQLADRESHQTKHVLDAQLEKAFDKIDASKAVKTIIAYEPVWAIGTGKTATPEMANDTIKEVRAKVADLYGSEIAQSVRILYGGSVKPNNIHELLKESDIDGALIGGAALESNNFLVFTDAASKK
ncbi:Triosephosphate isomerase [Acholeplasma oculi]|uniref:Triosephosphate isomerase n=1 Tax=Acholeplasma oculi TaxID=35623 RepID=A0A061AFN1_9MOLU|nr:triose-phosphate isomerase [Acholeplasma oculi]CDR30366.1 Triosephosphate isomerase [Acholeplasma oculi]SKC42244.1 triosephosphate isomerase [Acholeplasma oculi]SUT88879.1 Triosephosphate isomerase [Acholeplasma oculi]